MSLDKYLEEIKLQETLHRMCAPFAAAARHVRNARIRAAQLDPAAVCALTLGILARHARQGKRGREGDAGQPNGLHDRSPA